MAIDTLLDNAVKSAREGSVVEVTVQALKDHVQRNCARDKISPEEEHRFDELWVDDVEHHHQGNGLSLAIATRIIDAHEGTLKVL